MFFVDLNRKQDTYLSQLATAGSAVGGMVVGAGIGSVFPGIGTIFGSAVGGITGGIGIKLIKYGFGKIVHNLREKCK